MTEAHYILVEPDAAWAAEFAIVRAALEEALGDAAATVEHVGSTAVPDLPAKPVLDIDVVAASADDVPAIVERLAAAGWAAKGDAGIPGREAMATRADLPYHHLYVLVAGTRPHLDHVLLRDLLRRDATARAGYAEVKRASAHLLPEDRPGYLDAKSAFVEDLLRRARAEAGIDDADQPDDDGRTYRWRARLDAADVARLQQAAFGEEPLPGWWDRVRPRSLGWVSAHEGPATGRLVGFANLAWDGEQHVFLLDLAVDPDDRRQGVATRLVALAVARARSAGCALLHVDFETHLGPLYLDRAGFRATAAGLVDLRYRSPVTSP